MVRNAYKCTGRVENTLCGTMFTKSPQDDKQDWTIKRVASPVLQGRSIAASLCEGESDIVSAGQQANNSSLVSSTHACLPEGEEEGTTLKRDFFQGFNSSIENGEASKGNKRYRQDVPGYMSNGSNGSAVGGLQQQYHSAHRGNNTSGLKQDIRIGRDTTSGASDMIRLGNGEHPVSSGPNLLANHGIFGSLPHLNHSQTQLEEEALKVMNGNPSSATRVDLSNCMARIIALESLLARERYQYRLASFIDGHNPGGEIMNNLHNL